jgi:hypothetical protein
MGGFRFSVKSQPPPVAVPPVRIALWGPTGSGKDWLVHAFARHLNILNTSTDPRYRDTRYEYTLTDDNDIAVSYQAEDLKPGGTMDQEDFLYRFQRRPKPGLSLPAHAHTLLIHNAGGELLVDTGVAGLSHYEAELGFREARAILILLDISSLNPTLGVTGGYSGILASDGDYADRLRQLLALLSGDSQAANYLAVCLSKVDVKQKLWPGGSGEERWRLLRMFFPRTVSLLEEHSRGGRFHIAPFNTSAVGFLRNSRRPNFNPQTGEIANPAHWHPYHAAAPFFWIFQQLETQGGQRPPRNYLPYPDMSD